MSLFKSLSLGSLTREDCVDGVVTLRDGITPQFVRGHGVTGAPKRLSFRA
jgi:hypothetical protein